MQQKANLQLGLHQLHPKNHFILEFPLGNFYFRILPHNSFKWQLFQLVSFMRRIDIPCIALRPPRNANGSFQSCWLETLGNCRSFALDCCHTSFYTGVVTSYLSTLALWHRHSPHVGFEIPALVHIDRPGRFWATCNTASHFEKGNTRRCFWPAGQSKVLERLLSVKCKNVKWRL